MPGFKPFTRLLGVFALFTAAWAGADVCPDTDTRALVLLDKMSRNIQQISYHGVATLHRGGDMQVMQISHLVDQHSSAESMTELTGQGAQIERATHPLDCIHPGQQILRLGAALQAGDCELSRHYRLKVLGSERIAGRNAVRIEVQPRDMYRFGYVMYLDQETGLLLKSETIGRGSRVLEQFQFAHLSFDDSIPEISQVSVTHQALHPDPHTQIMSTPVSRAWAARWVPRGFTPTDKSVGQNGRRTYTDGLAVFSVFLEELQREIRPGEGLVRDGGTTSYTRGMLVSKEPVLVTVVGEVPVNTARMVADSIGWVD